MTKNSVDTRKIAGVRDYGIILSPVITEKSSMMDGVVFRVHPKATKDEIKRAVERIFSVQVQEVRTARVMGKPKRSMKSTGRRAGYKKAYVSLKEGQTIDIIEGL